MILELLDLVNDDGSASCNCKHSLRAPTCVCLALAICVHIISGINGIIERSEEVIFKMVFFLFNIKYEW